MKNLDIYNMKWLKLYENFEKSKVSIDDVIDCIEKGGKIYTNIIKDLPDNDPNSEILPVSVDDYGVVTVNIDGELYEVDINDITKIEFE
jgi:hypothetical protein